ncbi:MAG: hypothetical protein H6Q75_243 [Firmicutes bacterium]|nr:hypothetical protein [Bacillota bacterium]
MDIQQLRNFISVAEHLNFSAAAKELHISQPALSKQITDLESQTGLRLFIRNTRSVELTVAGAALLEKAVSIVARSEAAINKARLAAKGTVGHLHIGYIGFFNTFLPDFIKDFRSLFPNCDISFSQLDWGALNQAVIDDQIDIALTPSYGLETLTGISYVLNSQPYPLCAIVPQEHPLAKKSSLHIADLKDQSLVMLARSKNPLSAIHTRQLFLSNGFIPNVVATATQIESLLLMVATGIGITIQSRLCENYGIGNLKFLELEDCPECCYRAVVWKTTNSNPLIPQFISTIEK